jgi:hypothetical protein
VWQELPERRRFLTALKLKAGLSAGHFSAGFRVQRFRSIEVKGEMRPGACTAREPLGWHVLPSPSEWHSVALADGSPNLDCRHGLTEDARPRAM